MSSFKKPFGILSFALLAVAATSVKADENDVINVDVAASTSYDSNFFRLSQVADDQALGVKERSEHFSTLGLRAILAKTVGVQRLSASVGVSETRFQNNAYLNYQALTYDARWLWAVGRRWTGDVSIERSEALNSFADYSSYRGRNVRTIENQRFNGSYWFHSEWATVVGVNRTTVSNEQAFLADTDVELQGYSLGLSYRPKSGNSILVRGRWQDGSFSKRQFDSVSQFDNGFAQASVESIAEWRLSEKSQLRGRLEHLERRHDHFSDRDYRGWVGNADFMYAATGKLNLGVGYKRNLESFQQAAASYYVLDDFALSANWSPTSKVTVNTLLGGGQRRYRGAIVALPSGEQHRRDSFARWGIDLAYRPVSALEFRAGYGYEQRNVNDDAYDYRDHVVTFSAKATF